MNFTPEQAAAIAQDGNLIVTAGAGSGKTLVLVERYLRVLREWVQSTLADHPTAPAADASAILAITFTDKAAREMRDRVRTTVEQRARAAPRAERALWEACRTAIESARIGTIHSFCATLLRAHPAETGLDPQFVVLDEVEAGLLLAESIEAALGEAVAAPETSDKPDTALFDEFGLDELRTMLAGMVQGGGRVRAALASIPTTTDELLQTWNERFADAHTEALRELLTSTIWREATITIRQLSAVARENDLIGRQLLEVAAWLEQEMGSRRWEVGDGGWEMGDGEIDFTPIKQINLKGGSKKNWPTEADLQAAKEALRTLRDTYRGYSHILEREPDDALELRVAQTTLALRTLYGKVQEHYGRAKDRQAALDYDDLEHHARELLERYASVRTRWQHELSAILVDEFQDTNDDQRAIIYALTGLGEQTTDVPHHTAEQPVTPPTQRGSASSSLFVVGDGKQSIYRFRGADVGVFRYVEQDLLARGGQHVALNISFRTHPHLLQWINAAVAPILQRDRPLQMYEIPFEELVAHRATAAQVQCVELHLIAESEQADARRDAEAHTVAQRISALVDGAAGPIVHDNRRGWRTPTYGDIALLFQASTVFEHYERALRAADIPFLTTAGRGYYGRNEVQDLIHLLRILADPTDELALVGVLRSPLFALNDATILRLRFAHPHSLWDALMGSASWELEGETTTSDQETPSDHLRFARDTLRELQTIRTRTTVVELLRAALAMTGYLATISGLSDGERRRVNLEKLLEAARRAGSSGLSAYSAYLDTLLKAEPREGEAPLEAEGSVRLMTVHRSKGLEFPLVILPDLGRKSPARSDIWLAQHSYGLALQLRGDTSEWHKPLAYTLALAAEQRMERAERERLLYVALTRARDYLILSGPVAKKSGEDWLSRIVAALGWPWDAGGPEAGAHGALQVFRP